MELFLIAPKRCFSYDGRIDLRLYIRMILVTLIMFTMSGCSTLSLTLMPSPQPTPTHKFLAGASKIDITPPPGYPMGGHSIAGKIGRGFWLRLNARSIFMEDPNGIRMVLVSTDLWAMPAGLADHVAELVSQGQQDCVVGRSGIIIAATHTHQSPANFSTSPAYNTFASPLQGFDADLFEFLAKRIALSIENACQNRQEAEVFFSQVRTTGNVPLARNRSFEAFKSDPESNDILASNKDLTVGEVTAEYPFPDSYRAVDPAIQVLRIKKKEASHNDIAIVAFVAVHNTSMTHEAKVYNSDLFGAASIYLEKELSRKAGLTKPKPVVAIFNGAEGDISPAWKSQDRRDTVRLGEELAERIMGVPAGQQLEDSLNYRFEFVPIANKCFPCEIGQWGDFFDCPKTKVICTAEAPLTGVGALGGAEDGRTFFYYLGCREGIKDCSKNTPQGNKRPMLNCIGPAATTVLDAFSGHESPDDSESTLPAGAALTQLVADFNKLPDTIPLGIYSIGHLSMATLPGEFTMVMGKRIADGIEQRMLATSKDTEFDQHSGKQKNNYNIVLIGLANEYLSYFTTPEEYQMQAYEGASTLYGVGAGEFVRYYLSELAQKLKEGPPTPEKEVTRKYHTGSVKRFGIDTVENRMDIADKGFTPVLLDTKTGLSEWTKIPSFCWSDHNIILSSNNINVQATPRIRIMTKSSTGMEPVPLLVAGIPEDDTGLDFVSIIVSHNADEVQWCSFWLVPDAFKQRPSDFYFFVESTSGLHIESPKCFFESSGEVNAECHITPGGY